MKWIVYTALFAGGFVLGAVVAREIAIDKVESPIGKLLRPLIGDYASGQVVTQVDQFIRSN